VEGQIERTGKTPVFADYGTMFALCDPANPPETWSNELKNCSPPKGPKPLTIPPYQRKLVWKEDDLDALVNSKSNLFGTAILASFSQTNPWILIDGLQRFATVTAFLVALYDEVISPTPNQSEEAEYFNSISIQYQRLSPVYKHNHKMLLEHGRVGIKNSYKILFETTQKYVLEHMKENAEEFGEQMTLTLQQRQIAVDPYTGFNDRTELVSTFLEINSTGVNLSKLDLLRTIILSQTLTTGWSDDTIDNFENKFTEVFQPNKTNKFTSTLGTQMYNVMAEADDCKPQYIFPNWNSINKQTFDEFFEYIEKLYSLRKETIPGDKTKYL